MTRYSGLIGINRGFVETEPGIFQPSVEEVMVQGELINLSARWSAQSMNDTVTVRHKLSVITPERDGLDFVEVVYIWWQDQRWSVTAVEYKRPRVEFSIGGLYNG